MTSFGVTLAVGSMGIVMAEWVMWRLFRRRADGLDFPPDVDASHFRFFTIPRMRVCATVHTLSMLGLFWLSLTLAW